jgi:hypothetical protein
MAEKITKRKEKKLKQSAYICVWFEETINCYYDCIRQATYWHTNAYGGF